MSFLPAPLKRQISCGLHRLRHGFLLWTRPTRHSLFAGALTDLARTRSELIAENALLPQHLIVLRPQVNRPVCTKKEQVLLVVLARAARHWKQTPFLVQPDTLLGWHRQMFRW